jgi:hypothetical protein
VNLYLNERSPNQYPIYQGFPQGHGEVTFQEGFLACCEELRKLAGPTWDGSVNLFVEHQDPLLFFFFLHGRRQAVPKALALSPFFIYINKNIVSILVIECYSIPEQGWEGWRLAGHRISTALALLVHNVADIFCMKRANLAGGSVRVRSAASRVILRKVEMASAVHPPRLSQTTGNIVDKGGALGLDGTFGHAGIFLCG